MSRTNFPDLDFSETKSVIIGRRVGKGIWSVVVDDSVARSFKSKQERC